MENNGRKYLTTHGFIKYSLNLREATYKLWLLLGAAESKCMHLAGIPLRPEKQQELNQISLRKGVRATTAIEGNTLTEEDVERIYHSGADSLPLSRRYQAQEVENVLKVYNGIIRQVEGGKGCDVSIEALKADNALILKNVTLEAHVSAGEIRTYPVLVGNAYKGAPAEDCEYLLDKLFSWLNDDWGLNAEHPIVEGILKAIISHLYIVWIHPFGDGNGRTARVLEFRMLMRAGVPLTAAHLLTSYYNDTRDLYYNKLNVSSRKLNGELEFIQYAVQGFVDALDMQIASILEEQLNVTWVNYIHTVHFGGKLTPALRRRRDLLLSISAFPKAISLKELRYRLPAEILNQYQSSPRMLALDMSYLEKEGLIRKVAEGYEAAKDKVKAFLPLRREEDYDDRDEAWESLGEPVSISELEAALEAL